jgi:hypothetical protein
MNKNNKNIYILNVIGLGNKIYDLIIGLYLKQLYNYNIYFRDYKTDHTKINDYDLETIFVKLNKYVNIINKEYAKYIKRLNLKIYGNNIFFTNLDNFKKYFENDLLDAKFILNTFSSYSIIFHIYNELLDKYKKIFIINKSLINKNILKLSNEDYAVIHIRYGDKLKCGLDTTKIFYGIYTPEYYYNKILYLKRKDTPIYILTDSNMVVKKFILDKYSLFNDNMIKLLNISLIDSFYLMINSSYLIMSLSTLSYSSILLGKYNKNKENILCLPSSKKNIKLIPDLPDTNKIYKIFNSKYLLNYNKKLNLEMLDYYNKTNGISNNFYYKRTNKTNLSK